MGAILTVFSFYGRARRTYYGLFFLITVGVYFGLSMVFYVWMIKADIGQVVEKMKQQDPKTAEMLGHMQAIPMEAFGLQLGSAPSWSWCSMSPGSRSAYAGCTT